MEKFSELIKIRRSMRKFTPEKLTQEQINTLMRAALMSPSSKGTHCWQFMVVQDGETLGKLAHCKAQGAEFLENAPCAVVVMADPAVSDVWIEDASVASTMLLLQAEDMGLGACWVQVRERRQADGAPAEDEVRKMLDLPADLRVLSIIAVGNKGMERKPFNEERLLWDKVTCK